jgi:hypothetical protein
MRVAIEFESEDENYRALLFAQEMLDTIAELDEHLRTQAKYNESDKSDDYIQALYDVRTTLREMVMDKNIGFVFQ